MLKISELAPDLRERIQKQIREEDAHLSVAKLGAAQPKPNQVCALAGKLSPHKSRKSRVAIVITFCPFVNRPCDEDNFGHSGYKSVRDSIAATFGLDDGDRRIRFEYAPPVVTKGKSGTCITITAEIYE